MALDLRTMTAGEYAEMIVAAESFVEACKEYQKLRDECKRLAAALDTSAPKEVRSFADIQSYQERVAELTKQFRELVQQRDAAYNVMVDRRRAVANKIPFYVDIAVPKFGATVSRPNDGGTALHVRYGDVNERF